MMRNRTYRWLFLSLALFGFLGDQASKYGVFRWLYNEGYGDKRQVFEGKLELLAQFDRSAEAECDCVFATWSGEVPPRVNHGALFGLGNAHEGTANVIFSIVSVLAAMFILIWGLKRSTAGDWVLCIALGLILGGTMGNFYDRLVFGGVRDFIHFYWFEWPVFNVADCCLVGGAGALILQAFTQPATPEGSAEPAKAS